jgi:hypothetical protein
LTVVALALLVVVFFRNRPGLEVYPPWPVLAAVVAEVVLTFLALRRSVGPFWAVVAGVLLAVHPYSWKWTPPFDQALWVQALELAVLVGVIEGGRLAFAPRAAPLGWLVAFVWLGAGVAACWFLSPAAGAVAVLLTGLALSIFAGLASRQRRRPGMTAVPSRWNIFGAILVGVLAVCAGTLLAPLAEPYLGGTVRTRLTPGQTPWETIQMTVPAGWGWHLPGLTADELRQWSWPTPWAVLPLMAWGLWCTVSRGWKQSARRQPPLAWILTLYSGLALLGVSLRPAEAPDVALLPWAVLSVLLSVFCVGDTLRTLWERLRLQPPHERDTG